MRSHTDDIIAGKTKANINGEKHRMTMTMQDYSHTTIGHIQIGQIASSSPRKYSVQCLRCQSRWDVRHTDISKSLNAGLPLDCMNTPCRLGKLGDAERSNEQRRTERLREKELADLEYDRRMRAIYGGAQ